MEIVTFEEFIASWRPLYLLAVIVTLFAFGRWFYNEASGKNYYKRYPIAKAMDDLAASGELEGKDVEAALSSIDIDQSPQFQAGQFTQNIRGK